MRQRLRFLQNLGLVSTAVLLCLLAGELIVRAFVPVRDVGPSFTVYDPTYGKVLKAGSSIMRITPEFTMQLTTNSHGFRGPELGPDYAGSILFVGDSFTMGYGVTDGNEYPAIVRKAIAKCGPSFNVEVINAGIGDSGTGRAVKFLRKEGAAVKPRVVVLQIHANDFDDNVSEGLFALTESGDLLESSPPPPGADRAVQRFIESMPGFAYSHLVGLLRQIRIPGRGKTRNDQSPQDMVAAEGGATYKERLTLRLLREIVQIANQGGWQLVVVLADIPRRRHVLLEELFSGHRITTLSIPTKEDRPDLYYKVDGHWNANGHALAADRILQALRLPSGGMQIDCQRLG